MASTVAEIVAQWEGFAAMLAEQAAQPHMLIMSQYSYATFRLLLDADQKHWNWRRTKRELRKLRLQYRGSKSKLAGKPANLFIVDDPHNAAD